MMTLNDSSQFDTLVWNTWCKLMKLRKIGTMHRKQSLFLIQGTLRGVPPQVVDQRADAILSSLGLGVFWQTD